MVKSLRFALGTLFVTGIVLWVVLSKTSEPLLTLAAVCLHEFGHICASFIYKNKFGKLSFCPGGLMLSGNSAYTSYFAEATVAFAGPFFNLVTALAFSSASSDTLIFFRQVSLALALLNLLPIQEFDGGRILRCILSSLLTIEHSENICGVLSFLALFFIWSISVYLVLRTGRNVSALVFSVIIFLRMLKKNYKKRICEIIKE